MSGGQAEEQETDCVPASDVPEPADAVIHTLRSQHCVSLVFCVLISQGPCFAHFTPDNNICFAGGLSCRYSSQVGRVASLSDLLEFFPWMAAEFHHTLFLHQLRRQGCFPLIANVVSYIRMIASLMSYPPCIPG